MIQVFFYITALAVVLNTSWDFCITIFPSNFLRLNINRGAILAGFFDAQIRWCLVNPLEMAPLNLCNKCHSLFQRSTYLSRGCCIYKHGLFFCFNRLTFTRLRFSSVILPAAAAAWWQKPQIIAVLIGYYFFGFLCLLALHQISSFCIARRRKCR